MFMVGEYRGGETGGDEFWQGASTTSHPDIRGLRRLIAAEPQDLDPSGGSAV